jgi:hypothetical protein
MNATVLRSSLQKPFAPAKDMQARHMPRIQQTASGLDAAKVVALVRGA